MKRTWVSIKIIKCFRLKVDSRGSLHRRSMSTPDDRHNQHTKVSHQIIVSLAVTPCQAMPFALTGGNRKLVRAGRCNLGWGLGDGVLLTCLGWAAAIMAWL